MALSTGQDSEGATEYNDEMRTICDRITANNGVIDTTIDHNQWLAYYDLLTSPNTFSGDIRIIKSPSTIVNAAQTLNPTNLSDSEGSFHDIDELKRILGSVAKIDRLPSSNSLEGNNPISLVIMLLAT